MLMLQESLNLEQRIARRAPARLRRLLAAADRAAIGFMERYGLAALRVALAVVFIWFGVLKVTDRSPVEDIVKQTVFFLPGEPFFTVLGALEIAIGLGLLVPVAPRLTLRGRRLGPPTIGENTALCRFQNVLSVNAAPTTSATA